MVTLKIIFVLLFLSASTIVNVAGIFGARLRFPFPYPKFPAIPVKPKTTPAPTEPPPFSPLKDSKYCDESDLAKILSKEQRNKRAVNSWPFHCLYPSIIFDHGSYQFMRDIYTCCKKCNFPTYTSCIYAHGTPDWRCPSDGVHCIFECVKKYGPGVTDVIKKPDFTGIKSQITSAKIKITEVPKKLKCQKVEKLPNGKTCIRRLCVPLNLY